jgi:hypothetical protein
MIYSQIGFNLVGRASKDRARASLEIAAVARDAVGC